MPKVAKHRTALEASIPLACADESAAVEFLEQQRGWLTQANAMCPKCGVVGEARKMKAKDGNRNARYLWRCHACKQQFSVRVGTIMEDSPIPFRHWCLAFYLACASKKGISAKQIERETGLTYKSALFMMHRIRWATAPANENEAKLGVNGETVEYDETYVGGTPRRIYRRANERLGPAEDFQDRKTPVVGGVERGGRVKIRVAPDLKRNHFSPALRFLTLLSEVAVIQRSDADAQMIVPHLFEVDEPKS